MKNVFINFETSCVKYLRKLYIYNFKHILNRCHSKLMLIDFHRNNETVLLSASVETLCFLSHYHNHNKSYLKCCIR